MCFDCVSNYVVTVWLSRIPKRRKRDPIIVDLIHFRLKCQGFFFNAISSAVAVVALVVVCLDYYLHCCYCCYCCYCFALRVGLECGEVQEGWVAGAQKQFSCFVHLTAAA